MSACNTLTDELKYLKKLHADLQEALESDDIVKAQELTVPIQQVTKKLERSLLSSQEKLIKEKFALDVNMQISIYNQLGQTKWSEEIRSHKDSLIQRIFNNLESIRAKYNAGMRPVLMPGKKIQRRELEQSLEDLKPYWKIDGEIKTVKSSCLWVGYTDALESNAYWADIPDEPYVLWTVPSLIGNPVTTSMTVEEQQEIINEKHAQAPELYDETDMHPLEYAAFQVMHTHQGAVHESSLKDITPFDSDDRIEYHTIFVTRSVGREKIGGGTTSPIDRIFSEDLSLRFVNLEDFGEPFKPMHQAIRLVGRV